MHLKKPILILIVCLTVVACNYDNLLEIKQKSDYYKFYVDSISKLERSVFNKNLQTIEKRHNELKSKVYDAIGTLEKDHSIRREILESDSIYNALKIEHRHWLNDFKKQ
ncbi:hypothetical protein [Lacinutrix chionoecetis]